MNPTKESTTSVIFGFPEEWQDFAERNALFLERFPSLARAIALAFTRDTVLPEPIDKFVLGFGRVCQANFSEILLCCDNGSGLAAQQLLRGLYERAVTLRYLHEHPTEVEDFLHFHYVNQRKLMIACKGTMGKVFSPNQAEKIEKDYEAVKDKFRVTDCEKCGTKRINHTWSKLDFVAMAKKTILGKLIVPGYFIPLRQAHATMGSLLSMVEPSPTGGISFIGAAQRKEADGALNFSHLFFLDVLSVQEERFAVPALKEQIGICWQDFEDIWNGRVQDTAPSG
jgi:hypothetical protein